MSPRPRPQLSLESLHLDGGGCGATHRIPISIHRDTHAHMQTHSVSLSHTHPASIHTRRSVLSQPLLALGDRGATLLFRNNGGCHQEGKITLDRDKCSLAFRVHQGVAQWANMSGSLPPASVGFLGQRGGTGIWGWRRWERGRDAGLPGAKVPRDAGAWHPDPWNNPSLPPCISLRPRSFLSPLWASPTRPRMFSLLYPGPPHEITENPTKFYGTSFP